MRSTDALLPRMLGEYNDRLIGPDILAQDSPTRSLPRYAPRVQYCPLPFGRHVVY